MREINVFNSSSITGGDTDLGSPNEGCTPSGPGVGAGGNPLSDFPNCEPQGNLLIVQEMNNGVLVAEDNPDDERQGGCIIFTFEDPFELVNMGIMDIDEDEGANITVSDF